MNEAHDPDEMRDFYDFSGGVRGKYAACYAEGVNIVRLDPDVAAVFPDDASVNEALRTRAGIIQRRIGAAANTRSSIAVSVLVLLTGCRSAPPPAAPVPENTPADAFAVVAEADRLGAQNLWPGFDPRVIPVAIYDGERTLLVRHPAPPVGFQAIPGRPGVWSYPGRYPSVTANSSADIGGVSTATLMPAVDGVAIPKRAGTIIHEAFHVFQRAHHPGWTANEAELFTYPLDDPELLALRRTETEALRRALLAPDRERTVCWAYQALDFRHERFARMPPGAAGYERGTEWNEGLANYVESRATGLPDSAIVPTAGFAPEALRQRGYATGTAFARLLDRASPAWRDSLERNDSVALDVLLRDALGTHGIGSAVCELTPTERDRIGAVAAADVDALRRRRTEQRSAFLEQPGWRLTVAAPGAPLFPQGFDPLNVQTVRPSEVLHTRWLKLGNAAGTVEVLGHAALTEAAGVHPLFNGVRTLTITGLKEEPVVTEAKGVVTVKADGISAELRGAVVERAGRTVTIRLPPAP